MKTLEILKLDISYSFIQQILIKQLLLWGIILNIGHKVGSSTK